MSPTLKPCACGFVEEPHWATNRLTCLLCAAATPRCPAPEAAANCWNAMQMSLEEGVVGMAPLRWHVLELRLGSNVVGRVFSYDGAWASKSTTEPHYFRTFDTREQAEAALLAHVMEGK